MPTVPDSVFAIATFAVLFPPVYFAVDWIRGAIRGRLRPNPDRRFRYVALRIGPFILSGARQAQGAPVLDTGFTTAEDGRRYRTRVLHLRPWRRTEHGDRAIGPALSFGVESGRRADAISLAIVVGVVVLGYAFLVAARLSHG